MDATVHNHAHIHAQTCTLTHQLTLKGKVHIIAHTRSRTNLQTEPSTHQGRDLEKPAAGDGGRSRGAARGKQCTGSEGDVPQVRDEGAEPPTV